MKSFVGQEVSKLYNTDPQTELPNCPPPSGVRYYEWDELKLSNPNALPCQGGRPEHDTCALGRFQVTAFNSNLNSNETVFGTVLGCAGRNLLSKISEAVKARNTNGCQLEKSESPAFNSIKYYLELEHCAQFTELCSRQDYCISPKSSVIKPFINIEEGGVNVLTFVICFGVALGILITVVAFLGIVHG
jgi:hypothetical protein